MSYEGINPKGKHEYKYDRGSPYKVPNSDRVDGGGLQIRLAKEIETVLPGIGFCMHCFDSDCLVWFSDQLSAANETILDQAVLDHKNNL